MTAEQGIAALKLRPTEQSVVGRRVAAVIPLWLGGAGYGASAQRY